MPASAAAGALDSLASLACLLAVRDGDLAVVAVIAALYPAGTVLLARVILAERIGRTQPHRPGARRRGRQPPGRRLTAARVQRDLPPPSALGRRV